MYEVALFVEHNEFKTAISNIKNLEDLETLIDYGYVEIKGKDVILNLEKIALIVTFDDKIKCNEDILDGRDYYSITKVTAHFSNPDLRKIDLIDYFPHRYPFRMSLSKVIVD